MKVLGIAAVAVTLLSGSALAGEVFHLNLGNGKTARIQMRDCGDRFCLPWVSLRDGPSRSKERWTDEPRYSEREPEPSTAAAPTIPAPSRAAQQPAPPIAAPVIPAPQAAAIQPPPAARPEPVAPEPSRPASASANTPNPFEAPAAQASPAMPTNAENPFAAPAAAPALPAPAPQVPAVQPPAPAAQAAPPPIPQPQAPVRTAALPASQPAATGPIGEWIVEDGVGRVRIEECGKALCGVVSAAKDPNDTDRKNPDPKMRKRPIIGTPVLLDMQATRDNRWEGEVYNVRDGQTYTAKLSMRNPNTLRIEGCVMGGMFCGGQNWKRAQ